MGSAAAGRDEHERRGDDRGRHRDGEQDPGPGVAVGQVDERSLQDERAGRAEGDEQRGAPDAEAAARGVDGGHAEEGGVGDRGGEGGDRPERGHGHQVAEGDGHAPHRGRGVGGQQPDRHERDEGDAAGHEERPRATDPGRPVQQSTRGEAGHHHGDVRAEHPTAVGVGGRGVEPALDDHVQAGHAEPLPDAERHPEPGDDGDRREERHDRDRAGQHAEAAAGADPTQEAGRDPGAGQEADVVRREDRADDQRAEPGLRGPHAEQRQQEAVADHEDADPGDQRRRRGGQAGARRAGGEGVGTGRHPVRLRRRPVLRPVPRNRPAP